MDSVDCRIQKMSATLH